MWLLGAGASATSGIATAADMIWNFKRSLYCTEQRISIRACQDLSDPLFQQKLQRYFDGLGKYPALGSVSEYADFFTSAYPDEADRRRYIDRMVSQATPSYGHIALAVLMALAKVRIVWTTNFDRNVEDSAAKVFGTTARLAVATLDSVRLAEEAFFRLAKKAFKNSGGHYWRNCMEIFSLVVSKIQPRNCGPKMSGSAQHWWTPADILGSLSWDIAVAMIQ